MESWNSKTKFIAGKAMFIFILLFSSFSKATTVSGVISDEKKNALAYAGVYIAGTSIGTTSNSDGQYKLDLSSGNYELTFKIIGYSAIIKKVEIKDIPIIINVELSLQTFNLKEVVIKANAEDPAYEIIRNAQKKRAYFRDKVDVYYCDAYVKSTQRLLDHPESFMGAKVDVGEILDTVTKMFYLSESVSHLFYKHPSDYKEEMVSSKVSGSPKTYSFNQSTDVLINLYDNLVTIADISPRGIISPVSNNALFSYKYKLEGTFLENGKLIHRISVIPKRQYDPVFTGTIYIADDSWYIHSADLFITKNQQMEFLDTFRLKETFIVLDNDKVLPFNHQLSYNFNVFGFKGDGIVIGVFNNYDLGNSTLNLPGRKMKMKRGEVMKVNIDANIQDSAYWDKVRPMPLTVDEDLDYRRRDSAQKIHESQPYLDSIDHKYNKFHAGSLINGYSWSNSFLGREYFIGSPLLNINFNTVEGWNTHIAVSYNKSYKSDIEKHFKLGGEIRYGASNKHWDGVINTVYRYNPKNLSAVSLDVGSYVYQFNRSEPINVLTNFLYSVYAEKNYMKLYEKQFASFVYRSELFNGFEWRWNLEYAQRNSLSNTSNFKLKDVAGREYTSNYTTSLEDPLLKFPTNNSFTIDLQTKIRFGLEYISRPEAKYNLNSKYPTLKIEFKKAMKTLGGVTDYNFVKIGIEDEMKVGLLGRLKYTVSGSRFSGVKNIYFTDFLHFNGNKTFISSYQMNDFRNLPYYDYSTKDYAFEGHVEQNFGGFLLNKIPLIRKLKLKEVVGVHYLKTPVVKNYYEISVGVEKLNSFRIEAFTSIVDGKRATIGFMFGITKRFLSF